MTFHYHGPLSSNSALFQGRRQLLDELIAECTRDEVRSYHLVYGSPQSGKTSLLNRLAVGLSALHSDSIRPCRVDFQTIARASSEHALRFVAERIAEVLGPGCDVPTRFVRGGFEFHGWLSQQSVCHRLVLLLDDFWALGQEARQKVAGTMRAMFNSRAGTPLENLVVIFFGGIELFKLATLPNSPLQNVCRKYNVHDLTLVETVELLRVGFAASKWMAQGVDFSGLARAVFAQVGGHPRLTQRLSQLVLQEVMTTGTPLEPERVSRLARQLWHADEWFNATCGVLEQEGLVVDMERLVDCGADFEADPKMMKLELAGAAKWVDEQQCWAVRNRLLEIYLKENLGAFGKVRFLQDTASARSDSENKRKPHHAKPVVFVSYARKDNSGPDPTRHWLKKLMGLWAPYASQFDIQPWNDEHISLGSNWETEVRERLKDAKAYVLLVSAAFLDSEYVIKRELPIILERHVQHKAAVFPIIIEPCGYKVTKIPVMDGTGTTVQMSLANIQHPNGDRTLVEMSEGDQNRTMMAVIEALSAKLTQQEGRA